MDRDSSSTSGATPSRPPPGEATRASEDLPHSRAGDRDRHPSSRDGEDRATGSKDPQEALAHQASAGPDSVAGQGSGEATMATGTTATEAAAGSREAKGAGNSKEEEAGTNLVRGQKGAWPIWAALASKVAWADTDREVSGAKEGQAIGSSRSILLQ